MQLAQSSGEVFDPSTASIAFAMGVPAPLMWAAFTGGVMPVGANQSHDVSSYSAGVNKAIDMSWPGQLLVLGMGCLSAMAVWRWQQQYHRTTTGTWCTFAFLLGLAGLCAYWLEHRRAALDDCIECGATMPRDRDACAKCAAPFAAPPLIGTEIFAQAKPACRKSLEKAT